MITGLTIADFTNLILALSGIVGLFFVYRQTRASEKSINIKVEEVQELANRLEKESRHREVLHKEHEREVNERTKSISEIWQNIISTKQNDSFLEDTEKMDGYRDKYDYITITIYLAALLKDVLLQMYQTQGKNFNTSKISGEFTAIFNYLTCYHIKTQLAEKSTADLFKIRRKFENKVKENDSQKMTEVEKNAAHKIYADEYAIELDKLLSEYHELQVKNFPGLQSARNELTCIIKEILNKRKV